MNILESSILSKYVLFNESCVGKQLFTNEEVSEEIGVIQTILCILNYSITEITCTYDLHTRNTIATFKTEHGLLLDQDSRIDPLFDQKVLIAIDGRIAAGVYKTIRDIHPQKGLRINVLIRSENENELAHKIAMKLFPYKTVKTVQKMLDKNRDIFKTITKVHNNNEVWKKVFVSSTKIQEPEITPTDYTNIDEVWIPLFDFIVAQNWFRLHFKK